MWSSAAYTLSLKVTDKHSLNTAKKLHLCEKAWAKLSRHFAIFLSDKDSIQVGCLSQVYFVVGVAGKDLHIALACCCRYVVGESLIFHFLSLLMIMNTRHKEIRNQISLKSF